MQNTGTVALVVVLALLTALTFTALLQMQKTINELESSLISKLTIQRNRLSELLHEQVYSHTTIANTDGNSSKPSSNNSYRAPDDRTFAESVREALYGYVNSEAKLVAFLNTLNEDDPRLVQHIRDNLLITPAPATAPYSFSSNQADFSEGQANHIKKIFKNKRGGFFVECGGCDGEFNSNTIPLERELGWQGMLIEADPQMVDRILNRHRKTWTLPLCISLKNKPTMVAFDKHMYCIGRVGFEKKAMDAAKPTVNNHVNVHCVPFASVVYAFNRTSIDLFSLDVEGFELDILKTIPWDKIDIKVLIVEYYSKPSQKEPMKAYMAQQGYKTYGEELTNEKWARENFMFIKNSSGL